MQSLDQLSGPALKSLRNQCHVQAIELADKLAAKRKKVERKSHRTAMLEAAVRALTHLHDTAKQTVAALKEAKAPRKLIREQQALVKKYARELEALPTQSAQIPRATEIAIQQLKLDEMEQRCMTLEARVKEIDGLLK